MTEQPNQQNFTPETEQAHLREQVSASPERAKEIIKEHIQQTPEEVYDSKFHYTPEQLAEAEKRVTDKHYQEKESALQHLFEIAETKGILNAVKTAKNLPASVMDEFHDRLVEHFREQK